MEDEDFLANWILHRGRHSDPTSHLDVREVAIRILQMNGGYESLGQLWVSHFFARNPDTTSKISG